MSENRVQPTTAISQASTLAQIAEYWDTHSVADVWEQTHDVEFTILAPRRRRITLDPAVYSEIEERARSRGIQPETLVNLWLAERLRQAG